MDPHWLERISPIPHAVAHVRHKKGWVEPDRFIYDHELVLFRHGDFFVELDGQCQHFRDGDFLIVPPGVSHRSQLCGAKQGYRYCIHFDWTWIAAAPARLSCYRPSPLRRKFLHLAPDWLPAGPRSGQVRNSEAIWQSYKALFSRWSQSQDPLHCRGQLLQLLLELLHHSLGNKEKAHDQRFQIADRARDLIRPLMFTAIDRLPSLQKVLEESGVSYAHASRCFRHCFGISPSAYLSALRLERAKNLLRDSDQAISEIAQQVGYSSSQHFSTCFKRQFHCSPSAYRSNRLA